MAGLPRLPREARPLARATINILFPVLIALLLLGHYLAAGASGHGASVDERPPGYVFAQNPAR